MSQNRSITVVGAGRISAPVTVMLANLAASALRPTVQEALAASEATVRAIRQALAGVGVGPDDAVTTQMQLHPEQVWPPDGNGQPRTVGYRSTHQLELTLRDLAQAGAALGVALAAGSDDVQLHHISFEAAAGAGLATEALRAAWADALAKAQELAGLAGSPLGEVVSVTEQHAGPPMPIPMMASRQESGAAMPLDVHPGGVQVHAGVVVQWALASA